MLKKIASALGYIPKEEVESVFSELKELRSESEGYKAAKEDEIAKLQQEIARLEAGNSEIQERLKKLSEDMQKITGLYSQGEADLKISDQTIQTSESIQSKNEELQDELVKALKRINELEEELRASKNQKPGAVKIGKGAKPKAKQLRNKKTAKTGKKR